MEKILIKKLSVGINDKKLGIRNYLLLGELRQMKKYFGKIDINCLTSNTESLPNILESMSYGIP